ncbi:2-hydroxyacid dehydrogenase [Arthrobacter sp. KK5.5]|uniref:2-hydroxyacid dehydrogenase n=1 Tax=Arthrobacter sp. KK5.5 TaxID=3373084 RepID=UPI003EE5CB02
MTTHAGHRAANPSNGAAGGHILEVGSVNPLVSAVLSEEFDALRLPDGTTERGEFLDRYAEGIDVVVCSGRFGVDTELMRRLTGLKAIVNFGVGYDATDVAQARERGIRVSNTPDVLTDCVADTALVLYLDVLRRVSAADRFVRRGDWEGTGSFPLAVRASRKRVGVLGLGRIGSAIARRLDGFGCEIHYHNRRSVAGSPYAYADSVAGLAAAVDVLIVAAAGGPDSAGLVGADALSALGPDGYVVNVARGSVIDEGALVDALVEGRIAGAGLDVFADEPRVPPALMALDNVVLLPHLGSGTHETRRDIAELTLENLRSYLRDGSLVTPID